MQGTELSGGEGRRCGVFTTSLNRTLESIQLIGGVCTMMMKMAMVMRMIRKGRKHSFLAWALWVSCLGLRGDRSKGQEKPGPKRSIMSLFPAGVEDSQELGLQAVFG